MTETECARRAAPILARILARLDESDLVIAADAPVDPSAGAVSAAITVPGRSSVRPPARSGTASP